MYALRSEAGPYQVGGEGEGLGAAEIIWSMVSAKALKRSEARFSRP
jgi:hypothetical protein